MDIHSFENALRNGNMAENTIRAYLYALREFISRQKELTKRDLLIYKTYLIESYKPKTVNLRIQAINKYLDFANKSKWRLKSVKVQQRSYLENVISNADYIFLKRKLKQEENLMWYFVVRFLAATGARISELIKIKVEHVTLGYFDIYTKGGKSDASTFQRNYEKRPQNGFQKINAQPATCFLIDSVRESPQEEYRSN